MLNSSQFTRSAVIAATVVSLAASPAMARPADQPAASKATVASHTRHWTPARVDGTGVRPAASVTSAASAAPAVPLTRPADTSGVDWLLIGLVAPALLALLAIVAVVRSVRHRADSFHVSQV